MIRSIPDVLADNAFNKHLDSLQKAPDVPQNMVDATIHVHDTMESALVIAKSLFGGNAFTGADVIAIYDRIQAEWLRLNAGDTAREKETT
jgi:hypothetical protein